MAKAETAPVCCSPVDKIEKEKTQFREEEEFSGYGLFDAAMLCSSSTRGSFALQLDKTEMNQ